MRHFLCSGPIAALPLCMRVPAAQTGLIAATRGTNCLAASQFGAIAAAVAIAAIAVAADQRSRTATSAQVAPSRRLHWQSGPMDSGH